MLQYLVPHAGHSVARFLFVSQHSLFGSIIFGSPISLWAFSSAVSNGLRQWSQAKYPYSEFHENWQHTRGFSSNMTSPSLNVRLETNPLPCETRRANKYSMSVHYQWLIERWCIERNILDTVNRIKKMSYMVWIEWGLKYTKIIVLTFSLSTILIKKSASSMAFSMIMASEEIQ